MDPFRSTHVFTIVGLCSLLTISESASALSFTTVEAGGNHSCGISPEQRLWCWGSNVHGQLGTGPVGNSPALTPQRVSGLEGVTDVSVGTGHTCAIAGGEAWCWGYNLFGQLGHGTAFSVGVPTRVAGELAGRVDVTSISAGNATTCATAGGGAYCWGNGVNGEIGNGANESVDLPVQVWTTGATAIAVGESHVCAIAQDAAWCWGRGLYGALGHGSSGNSAVPVAVLGLPDDDPVMRVTAGMYHSCAIAAGKAWCWGGNNGGQLGTGDNFNYVTAVSVVWSQQSSAIDISAGLEYTCAIDGGGRAWCWGSDSFGQLGNDFALEPKYVPTPVYTPFASNVTALDAGVRHTCGLSGGVAHCWGGNASSQLGLGIELDYAQVPVPVNTDRLFDAGFDP